MSEELKNQSSRPTLDDVHTNDDDSQQEERSSGRRRRRSPKQLNLKCPICESNEEHVSYKDVYLLKKFTSVRGKIISPEKSGVCAKHQRELTTAIKRARYVALLPFVAMD